MKKLVKYCGLAALLAGAAFCLPTCGDTGTGPEPYDGPWKIVPCPEAEGLHNLKAVYFLSSDLGYAVGSRHILKYENGVWKVDYIQPVEYPPHNPVIDDIWFNAPNDGWAVGAEYDPENRKISKPLFLHYDGNKWLKLDHDLRECGFSSLFFLNGKEGWAVGWGIARWDGIRWRKVSEIGFLEDVYFNSPADGWAIGYYGPKIYHYDGSNWEKVYEQTFYRGRSIAFSEPKRGWAAGGRTMMMEYKSGKWGEYVLEGMLYGPNDIHFSSPENGWAVGNWTYRWNGEKWQRVEDPIGNVSFAVFTINERDAWAVGDARLIMHYEP